MCHSILGGTLYLPVSIYSINKRIFFTLKEDVEVADKALAADARDNMEP